jgi:hypothetical protein
VTVGEWPSEATLVADVAAFVTPGGMFPGWSDLRGPLAAEGDDTVGSFRLSPARTVWWCSDCGEGKTWLAELGATTTLASNRRKAML